MADFSIIGDTKLNSNGFATGLKGLTSTGIKILGTGLAAAATGIVAFGAYATKTGQAFDAAMSQVASTMGTTVDQIDSLTATAKKMGATTKFTATEAAEGLNYLALAGYTAEQQMAALPTVLNLAAAGSMELATASDLVTDAMAAMGMEATQSNLDKYADQMAKTASKSNTSVQQLGEATLVAGGQAKLCGMNLTDMNTALGILADNGIKGSEGGTALRNVLKNLYTPTTQAQKAIDALGVSTVNADGTLRDAQDVLQDLNGALGNLTEAGRVSAMNDIFDTRTIAAANNLLKDSGERWDELSGYIGDSAGACAEMAATQLDNLGGDVTLLQSAFSGFALSVYNQIKPALREFVQLGTDAVGQLQHGFEGNGVDGLMQAMGNVLGELVSRAAQFAPKMISLAVALLKALMQAIIGNAPLIMQAIKDAFETALDSIADVFPALTPVVDALKWVADNIETIGAVVIPVVTGLLAFKKALEITKFVQGVITTVKDLGAAFTALGTAGPIALVIAAIAALAAGFVYLYNTNETFRNAVNSIWAEIQSVVTSAMQVIYTAMVSVVESIKPIIEAIATTFVAAWDMVRVIWDFVQPYFAAIGEQIQAVFAVVAPVISQFFSSAWQIIQAVWSVAVGYFSTIWNTIAGIFSVVAAVFSGNFSAAWEAIQGIVGQWTAFFSTVWAAICGIFSAVGSFFSSVFSAAWQGICLAFSSVGAFFSGIISQIFGLFASLPSQFMAIGSNIVQGLWNGIQSGWDWLTSSVKSLANSLFEGVKSALGIHSPSKKFAWIGQMSAKGVELGFNAENPIGAIKDNVSAQIGKFNGAFKLRGGVGGTTTIDNSIHTTFQVPVKTPSETARAIYRQRTAGLAGARA